MKAKEIWQKFWFLLWKDDSPKGWIFSILFIIIFIKFLFLPSLSLITGTSLPIAIIESCSMYHDGNLFSNTQNWYERHEEKYQNFEIDYEQIKNFPLKKGLNKGDIIFIIGIKPDKIKIGDVIIFDGQKSNPIIHRVIEKNINSNGELTFSTIGDNNNGQLTIEKEIKEDQIIGKAVWRMGPYLGWLKLIFFEPLRSPSERGFCEEN